MLNILYRNQISEEGAKDIAVCLKSLNNIT